MEMDISKRINERQESKAEIDENSNLAEDLTEMDVAEIDGILFYAMSGNPKAISSNQLVEQMIDILQKKGTGAFATEIVGELLKQNPMLNDGDEKIILYRVNAILSSRKFSSIFSKTKINNKLRWQLVDQRPKDKKHSNLATKRDKDKDKEKDRDKEERGNDSDDIEYVYPRSFLARGEKRPVKFQLSPGNKTKREKEKQARIARHEKFEKNGKKLKNITKKIHQTAHRNHQNKNQKKLKKQKNHASDVEDLSRVKVKKEKKKDKKN